MGWDGDGMASEKMEQGDEIGYPSACGPFNSFQRALRVLFLSQEPVVISPSGTNAHLSSLLGHVLPRIESNHPGYPSHPQASLQLLSLSLSPFCAVNAPTSARTDRPCSSNRSSQRSRFWSRKPVICVRPRGLRARRGIPTHQTPHLLHLCLHLFHRRCRPNLVSGPPRLNQSASSSCCPFRRQQLLAAGVVAALVSCVAPVVCVPVAGAIAVLAKSSRHHRYCYRYRCCCCCCCSNLNSNSKCPSSSS